MKYINWNKLGIRTEKKCHWDDIEQPIKRYKYISISDWIWHGIRVRCQEMIWKPDLTPTAFRKYSFLEEK
jgi:hypothetical protein